MHCSNNLSSYWPRKKFQFIPITVWEMAHEATDYFFDVHRNMQVLRLFVIYPLTSAFWQIRNSYLKEGLQCFVPAGLFCPSGTQWDHLVPLGLETYSSRRMKKIEKSKDFLSYTLQVRDSNLKLNFSSSIYTSLKILNPIPVFRQQGDGSEHRNRVALSIRFPE